jgi:hypothetical protein
MLNNSNINSSRVYRISIKQKNYIETDVFVLEKTKSHIFCIIEYGRSTIQRLKKHFSDHDLYTLNLKKFNSFTGNENFYEDLDNSVVVYDIVKNKIQTTTGYPVIFNSLFSPCAYTHVVNIDDIEKMGFEIQKWDGEYGKAISLRPKGKKIINWFAPGYETDYFGEPISDNIAIGIYEDGGTRIVFNGYVHNIEELNLILNRTA